tara:strand:- start:158889 stop:159818 length:930 start_codon:yes stop_codon:yes gene_type:complete
MKKYINWYQTTLLLFWLCLSLTVLKPDFITNWFMSVTMLFGSFIAGATSEGGGAVAFPVMTLGFNIKPSVARDFSLLIQSFGMSAAAYTIFKKRIPIQRDILLPCVLSGFFGQLLSLLFLEGHFSPTFLKITFTSIWLSFALVLFLQHRVKSLKEVGISINFLLIIFALFGGVVTALTGSGIDILIFSLITLHYGVSEKIATPTSVVLMAALSITGVVSKFFLHGIETEALNYWAVCAPVVIFGAPLGAIFISKRSKKFIVIFLQTSIILQFLFSLYILNLSSFHIAWSTFLVLFGTCSFYLLFKYRKS